MKHSEFDVVVIGGGHAGLEAALAATRLGARTALVTLKRESIGVMSCNPAIGGLGKGHLVREIDALDGAMGRLADAAGIQFRLLNRRKGPAVQGPRAQSDRKVYHQASLAVVDATELLTLIEAEVIGFREKNSAISGVFLADGSEISARATVLTAGTFLRGVIHIGHEMISGGRLGDSPVLRLAEAIDDFSLPLGRLKTGTPPRLSSKTINWAVVDTQPGDQKPEMLSFLSKSPPLHQIACGITHTNEQTHSIIRANLGASAMYGGQIEAAGPRYCPSIEDKITRFSDKSSHQVFLEPEGLTTDWVYPNGISTSLPVAIQEQYVRSIRGLEKAEIVQPGYAIEYDFIDPRSLTAELEVESITNLFLAGQINGTTGYEEAAAQGLVAGLNAACRALGVEPLHLSRTSSYIGVMIDDLTTRGITEPYRMFTSRAEFRLSLRADNADQRLTPAGISLGCISPARTKAFLKKQEELKIAQSILKDTVFTPQQVNRAGIDVRADGKKRSAFDLLSIPGVSMSSIKQLVPNITEFPDEIQEQIAKDALYANYIKRQESDILALKRDENLEIPKSMRFKGMPGLSNEIAAKLEAVRPKNIAQAARIEGVTPAALTLILGRIRQEQRKKAV